MKGNIPNNLLPDVFNYLYLEDSKCWRQRSKAIQHPIVTYKVRPWYLKKKKDDKIMFKNPSTLHLNVL